MSNNNFPSSNKIKSLPKFQYQNDSGNQNQAYKFSYKAYDNNRNDNFKTFDQK